MPSIRDREAMYVAIFVHDIAKGRPEDHSIAGAKVARRLCQRFGFDGARSELHELLQTSTNGNDAAITRMTEFMHMTTEEGLYADFDPAARLFPPSRR